MAELKKILEDGLMLHKRMDKLFPEGATLNVNRPKHIKLKTKLLESSDGTYDNHECIVTIVSNEELSFLINVRAVIAAMRGLKDDCPSCAKEISLPHIAYVIDDEPVFNDKKNQVDIRFQVINNIER